MKTNELIEKVKKCKTYTEIHNLVWSTYTNFRNGIDKKEDSYLLIISLLINEVNKK